MRKLSFDRSLFTTWSMSPEVSTKGLYFALVVPLACMIFLLEWEPRILIFVFLAYSSGVIGFLLARSSMFQGELVSEEDRLLRLLAAHIGDLVMVHRFSDTSNIFVSKSIFNTLGYQVDEIICKYDTFLIHPDDRKLLRGRLQKLQENKKPSFLMTLRVLTKDGLYQWMEVHTTGVNDEAGVVTHAVLCFRDASERIEMENATRQFAEELIRKTSESNHQADNLSNINYMMTSHDLKEPMRTIQNYINILHQKYTVHLDSTGQECVQYIKDGAERMSRLIEDVLAFSKLGVQSNLNQQVDLNSIVQEVLQSIDLQVVETNTTISYEDLPTIRGDRRQLYHLFQNLIENAMKYRSERAPVIQISWEKKDGSWEFSIRDNGIGIKEEFQDAVFEVFRRLHSISQYNGSGIGLAICKRIVENHGGKIWVESEGLGCGSTFRFTLEVGREKKAAGTKIYQPASWSKWNSSLEIPKTIESQ